MTRVLLTTLTTTRLTVLLEPGVPQLGPIIKQLTILETGPQITARGGQVMTVVTTPATTPGIIILRILNMVAPLRIHQDTAVKLFALVIIMLNMGVNIALTEIRITHR